VVEPALQQQLIDILQAALRDNRLAWDLDGDGHYRLRTPAPGEEVRDFQATMMAWAQARSIVTS
jgi:polyphosphate kinase